MSLPLHRQESSRREGSASNKSTDDSWLFQHGPAGTWIQYCTLAVAVAVAVGSCVADADADADAGAEAEALSLCVTTAVTNCGCVRRAVLYCLNFYGTVVGPWGR